jgi:hypothetical protein
MAKDGYVDAAVVLSARERLAPVAVIAHSGPSSSPPTGSQASSTEHILDHINIWINCCCCNSSSSSSSIIFFFRDEELGWMDDGTDEWKGQPDRQTPKILYIYIYIYLIILFDFHTCTYIDLHILIYVKVFCTCTCIDFHILIYVKIM